MILRNEPPHGDSGEAAAQRPRVLLLAYACMPNRGSECSVGWNRALQVAQHFDTWVLCEGSWCRSEIERYLAQHGPIPGLRFVYVEKGKLLRLIGRVPGLYYLSYNLWHRRAFRVARQLHAEQRFALAHQSTYCGFREPGYLWKLDLPFVWGPIGGTQNLPWRFLGSIGIAGAASEILRSAANGLQLRFRWRVRLAARRAALLLTANSTNRAAIAAAHGVEPRCDLLDTGVRTIQEVPRPPRRADQTLRILWAGECRSFKALPILLHALAQLPADVSYRLQVLGDGPQRRRWQRIATRLGLDAHVDWSGWLPHNQALDQYRQADLFVFTSLRDTTGTVVLEALASGLPVVCFDHQGVRDVIDDDCGIKIPVTTPAEAIDGYCTALTTLARDHEQLEALSRGARERAKQYLWSQHGATLVKLYREVLAQREDDRPANAAWRQVAADTPALAAALPAPTRPRLTAPRWTDMREYVKDMGKSAAGRAGAGINRVWRRPSAPQLGILVYHRIAPHVPGLPKPTMNVPPARFEAQLAGLLNEGWEVWPLQKVLQRRAAGRPLPPRTVVITFDDAYESVYRYAWPVLHRFQAPATAFVATAYLDSPRPFPFDHWGSTYCESLPGEAYRLLTSEQCREMAASGLMEIGAHTHTHRDFRGQPEVFRRDLQQSVDLLREWFGKDAVTFAFPYGRAHLGYTSPELMEAARATGVLCALTTEAQPVEVASDPFGWPRFNVYQWDTAATLAGKFAGWYSWAPRLQESFRRRAASTP